ncbi:unnamed protein product [Alopecurus aequalis]
MDMDSTCTEPKDDISMEEYRGVCQKLRDRMTPVDTDTELDQEQFMELHHKHALYRIKAALLLKGKPVEELDDDAAPERKYPWDLIVENKYFLHYVYDGYFGWYFDSDLCHKESLTDYQRLVLSNDEYIWNMRLNLPFLKDLDGIFYEIWRRMNKNHKLCFREALRQRGMQGSYERYARKKLKIAELIGLIPRDKKAAA